MSDDAVTDAQRQLVEDHLDIAQKEARILTYRLGSHNRRFGEFALSDGYMALVRAAKEFDPANGASFRTYAIQRVRGAVLDSIRGQRRHNGYMRTSVNRETVSVWRYVWVGLDEAQHHPAPGESPFAEAEHAEQRAIVAHAPMTPRERSVVWRRLFRGQSQSAIARALGVNDSRISQLQHSGFKKLQHYIHACH